MSLAGMRLLRPGARLGAAKYTPDCSAARKLRAARNAKLLVNLLVSRKTLLSSCEVVLGVAI